MASIKVGSNTFSAARDFVIFGIDDAGHLVFGGFGPSIKTPLVWVTFKEKEALLNASLADADGEPVLAIRNNVITLNKENIYEVVQHPENQIPADRIVVTNQYGETALDLWREGNDWNFNGDFYHGQYHVVATPQGTVINPRFPSV